MTDISLPAARRRMVLPAVVVAVLAVALSACATTPPAVGTVSHKETYPAHKVDGYCMGDGVTTPLICTSDHIEPAEYFIRVARTDGRYVRVALEKSEYDRYAVGDRFDENSFKNPTFLTWEQYQDADGDWVTGHPQDR